MTRHFVKPDPNPRQTEAEVLRFIVARGIAHRRLDIEPALNPDHDFARDQHIATAIGALTTRRLIKRWAVDKWRATDAGRDAVALADAMGQAS